jgi:hypothetical protein
VGHPVPGGFESGLGRVLMIIEGEDSEGMISKLSVMMMWW